MSTRTTNLVTRNFAIQAIMQKVMTANDKQLEDLLETALDNILYNFSIVTEKELEENKAQEFPMPSLTDLNNLPESY